MPAVNTAYKTPRIGGRDAETRAPGDGSGRGGSISIAHDGSSLARAVEDLTREVGELKKGEQRDILTAREAAELLSFKSVDAFEYVVRKEGVPKHYISESHPRYFRDELRDFVRDR